MKPQTSKLIKAISIIAIAAALGLELWNTYLHLNNAVLSNNLQPWFWLANILLIGHGIEGAIAAKAATSRDKNPITYGIYTFFVGFIGLQELFEQSN